ncbi:MAG: glutamine--tRNA ligase/YqeY domain fusion protein [Polyangiaceae bacterium]
MSDDSHTLTHVESKDFIREKIERDIQTGKYNGRVVTRFPPEPNGYLHIGHSKSICLNFGLAKQYGGRCHLRFDDTNPTTEDPEFVESIQADIRWLGFDWGEHLYFASDYFEKLYHFAEELIRADKAYVCSLNGDQVREYRGTISEPGRPSPNRDASVEENLELFRRMRAGEFKDGEYTLRAKIDMAHPNMKLRDPPIYRIRHAHHYRTGDKWCIYPLYDFTHGLSDAIEGVTHSICTLEFENNRPLYDWFVEAVDALPEGAGANPQQTEFARLNITYMVMSKRKFLRLVNEKHVAGWDDPRMPTVAGLRRRGYTPESIRAFAERVGVAKNNSLVEIELLEHTLREDLNQRSPRVMCVLRPLKLILKNFDEVVGKREELEAPYYPPDVGRPGSRKVPLTKEIWIEQDDFAEEPPPKWHRLAPGASVRLRYGYVITCEYPVVDEGGKLVEVIAKLHTPEEAEQMKVKGTIHWVSAEDAVDCEVRLYDRLFSVPEPDALEEGVDFITTLNPKSLEVLKGCKLEPAAANEGLTRVQFERHGFFYADLDSKPDALIFNRTVSLKDSWARQTQPKQAAPERRRAQPKAAQAAQAPKPIELDAAAQMLVMVHGITPHEANVVSGDERLGKLLVGVDGLDGDVKAVTRWLVNDVASYLKGHDGEPPFGPAELIELVELQAAGTLSSRLAKDVFAELVKTGDSPKAIVERLGGGQIDDEGELTAVIKKVLSDNPDHVKRYREGNQNLIGAFVGQVMRATGGKANPKLVNELLRRELNAN